MSQPLKHVVIAFLSLALLAVGCGSDPSADSAAGQEPRVEEPLVEEPLVEERLVEEPLVEERLPVEPDGGIGDGAGPLPGVVDDLDEGSWHGAQVAETNCPGVEFTRVHASNFSFSVPVDFAEVEVQGVDSEIGVWSGGNNVEVSFDYGWYSGDFSQMPGAEVEAIEYSGIVGKHIVVRDAPENFVGVFFAEVALDGGEWNRLNLDVRFPDANDEIIGRCIVGSISWDQG